MASFKRVRSRGRNPLATRIVSAVRKVSWLLGIAALAALSSGAVGPAVSLVTLGAAVVAPGVARQATMRLRPAPQRLRVQQAFIEAEAAKSFQRRFRRGSPQPKLLRAVPSTQAADTPAVARPTEVYNIAPGEYSRACRELAWTGRALTVTDRRGNTSAWATVSGGVQRGTRLHRSAGGPAAAPDLGDLFVAELAATKSRFVPLDRVHLLDRWSRRLATVPVIGITEEALAALAARAGVAFTVYEMPPRITATPETLVAVLFPRSVFFRRPSGMEPEWRWLEPLLLVRRALRELAAESMFDPQGELAMRRANRRTR